MRVSRIDYELGPTTVRVVFRELNDSRVRRTLDLDATDLAELVRVAQRFEKHQRAIADSYNARASTIRRAIQGDA